MKRKINKPLLFVISVLVLSFISILSTLSFSTSATTGASISTVHTTKAHKELTVDNTLTIISLNLAHGRGNGRNQLFQSKQQINKNLDQIIDMLARENAQILLLQEADGPSFWSGNFNHVEKIVNEGHYHSFINGAHVNGLKLRYGTAIVSNCKLSSALAYTFKPSWPTFSKGFTVSTIKCFQDKAINIVSVHLDFASKKVRLNQVKEIVSELKTGGNPLIVAGDFNSDWDDTDSAIKYFAQAMDLRVWQPDAKDLITFKKLEKRLDWILISKEFDFIEHKILTDIVSDHSPVLATIK